MRQHGSSPEALARGGQVADLMVLPQMAFGCSIR
jgi:hypothetical protein